MTFMKGNREFCGGVSGLQSESQTWWHSLYHDTGQPSLALDQLNVTALIGHTATLPCRVTNLGSRTGRSNTVLVSHYFTSDLS
ncbi:hypothetical protein Pmani_002633 [Petrolisthes manimaculis]|uniref:Ig-like domain-containing protein n=1 Tax=Petrolisthes manimaculis TaxID=1843537 RepID=A0AAE1QK00_9EUCA|nr:hypothetical protein Pmani_002633 [Petrolisthes manimaculis]